MTLLSFVLWTASAFLHVDGEADFAALPERLDSVLATGERSVCVELEPGLYKYDECFLSLEGLEDLSLTITGEDAWLVAERSGDGYSRGYGYVDLAARVPVDVRNPVKRADFWPIPVLSRRGVYKIKCKEPDRTPEEVEGWTIILSQWFKGAVYPVVEIKNGWLYFRKDVDYGVGMWTELRYGRCLPRYILCTPPKREDLHPCGVSNFLTVKDCDFKELRLEGLRFLGNGEGRGLIVLDDVDSERIDVTECSFLGLRSDAIVATRTDGLNVTGCLFQENYLSSIRVMDGSRDAVISGNRFMDNGIGMTNAAVVRCRGVNYRVSDNYFEDFSYSAISVGLHYTTKDIYGTCGVVENNEICMSERFRSGVPRALIDGGAIYILANQVRTVIRNNYIHDLTGPHGNRGIFADDGPINVTIAGNRVERIHHGYCIDLRRCLRIALKKGTQITKPNMNNHIIDNTYDGGVRLYIRRRDPTSEMRNNVKIPVK